MKYLKISIFETFLGGTAEAKVVLTVGLFVYPIFLLY